MHNINKTGNVGERGSRRYYICTSHSIECHSGRMQMANDFLCQRWQFFLIWKSANFSLIRLCSGCQVLLLLLSLLLLLLILATVAKFALTFRLKMKEIWTNQILDGSEKMFPHPQLLFHRLGAAICYCHKIV